MSFETTSRFIEEFNYLDRILKDMYPNDVRSKLGVTRYLEDMMANAYSGSNKVPGWRSDYERLRSLRNLRNDAIHNNMLTADLFDSHDIDWIVDFRHRILSGEDPLSRLKRFTRPTRPQVQAKPSYAPPQRRYKPERIKLPVFPIVLLILLFIILYFL